MQTDLAIWVPVGASVVVAALVWILRRVARIQAFSAAHRWLPPISVLLWALLAMVWLRWAFRDADSHAIARGVLILLLAIATLPWLRNAVHSVVFALESRYRLGDDLRVGEIEGRLVTIGSSVIVLRATNGTEAAIPHARLATDPVVRLSLGIRDAPCEMQISVPAWVHPERAVELCRLAAALSPYAAPTCRPQVLAATTDPTQGVVLRVTGFVFDRDHEQRYRSDVATRIIDFVNQERPSLVPSTSLEKTF